LFLAPDNGILSCIPAGEIRGAWSVTRRELFLRKVSNTFHGRDIFAPVAAKLEVGMPPEKVGPRVRSIVRVPLPQPKVGRGVLRGEVAWVDRFGNLVTNIPAGRVRPGAEVWVQGGRISKVVRAYGDAPAGTLVALEGSGGFLEVSLVGGSASARLGAREGAMVEVRAG
jgi:hypothetical protein